MKIYTLILSLLFLICMSNISLSSSATYYSNISQNYSLNIYEVQTIEYNNTYCYSENNCTIFTNYTDVYWFKSIEGQCNQVYNVSSNISYDGNILTGNGFVIELSNYNRTQNISIYNSTKDFVILKFNSNYIMPEKLQISLFDEKYEYSVTGNTNIYVPINLKYESIDWPSQTNNTIKLSLNYTINSSNFSGVLDFNYYYSYPLEAELIQDYSQYNVNDLIVFKIISNSKIPILNLTAETNRSSDIKILISPNEGYVYFTPKQSGEYYIQFNVTDYLGNSKNISEIIDILPLGTVYFQNYDIPSIKIGDRTKIKIYSNDAVVPINYTLVELNFTPYELVNQSSDKYVDVYLSDDNNNNYFSVINRTATVSKPVVYLNINPIVYGELTLKYEVQVPEDLRANTEFTVRAKVGNQSIFEKQEINIAGVTVVCELSDNTDLTLSTRKCSAEFPIEGNYDNNIIILQQRDYEQYQAGHQLELSLLEEQKNKDIKTRENWLMIFIALFAIAFIVLIYILIPKDWLVFKVKKEK